MGHPDPRQDEKTLLVGEPTQARLSLRHRPTDEPIPHGDFPGGRTKDHHRQLPSVDVLSQVLHVLADRAVETAIMVLGQQLSDSPP